jgi:RNA polymerase sigma-70 factor (ECF subfamily)
MQPNVSDPQLAIRARSGDASAFEQIYQRYATAIFRYIYYRTGDVELAEDLRAEVFLRMYESLHRYEDRGWPISAWLYRIAHDRTVDALRRRRIRNDVPLDAWDAHCDGPEQSVDRLLEYEQLKHTLNELTDEQRQVIQMRFMADLPIHEVARRLGRTEGAVKALQVRGLRSLARRMRAAA